MNVYPHKRRPPIFVIIIAIAILIYGVYLVFAIPYQAHARQSKIDAANTPITIAEAATLHGHDIDGTQAEQTIVISESLDLDTNSTYRSEIKADCFEIQRALWQHYPHVEVVQITVRGPKQGGGLLTYGSCTLKWANAVHAPWDQLDAESAWDIYDYAGFNPSIQN